METKAFISFPPGLLRDSPLKLAILHAGNGWVVVDKPGWLPACPDPWNGSQLSLQEALQREVKREKPELMALGFTGVSVLPPLDPGCGGPVVVAGNRDRASRFKEAWGSDLWTLRFLLLAADESRDGTETRECSLPVARHFSECRALVSHRTGKKARTIFRRLAQAGRLGLWEAETTYLRPHQVRVHAVEVGLRMAGDDVYDGSAPVDGRDLGRALRETGARPLHAGPCLFLRTLALREEGTGLDLQTENEPPKSMQRWLKANGIIIP